MQDNSGQSALMASCGKSHFKISKLLLENGANTDFQDTSGLTALMISSLFNIVQLLIVLSITLGWT